MIRIFTVLNFLFLFIPSFAQSYKFGKIPKEHWEISKCTFDSSSKALIIFEIGNISIKGIEDVNNRDPECKLKGDFYTLFYERNQRIKILSNDLKNAGPFSIALRKIEGKIDKLVSFKGISIYKVNGKEVEKKFNLNDLIKVVSNEGNTLIILELPDAKEGTIFDFKYQIESNILNEIPVWTFSNNFPSLYSEITYTIPNFFNCQKVCDILDKLTFESFKHDVVYGVSYAINNGWKYSRYEYYENIEKYSLSNILSMTDPNSNNALNFLVKSIDFFSVKRTDGAFVK